MLQNTHRYVAMAGPWVRSKHAYMGKRPIIFIFSELAVGDKE
ncbi:MAG: hypothetical protein ACTSVZ_01990 [Promethearchaeota archaeon]